MQKDEHEEGLGILIGEDKPPELPKKEEKKKVEPTAPTGDDTKIFAIKTQVGQERTVADLVIAKAKKTKTAVHSVLAPQELRGYVFVEADDVQALERVIKIIGYARTMLTDPVPFAEIEHFLTPVSAVAKISEGDIVELVSGPFRGEKAKVTRIDDAKEEITVELFEAMVPIPVTVKGENVRVLKRHDDK
jgi:transcription termination/antitermination protein NusG